jgi:hypothetical protein
MSDRQSGDYEVGYGKPPMPTRFRKGQSGNAGGRLRGITAGRAIAFALKEAYRMIRVKEGDSVVLLPALQAIMRGQVALAAKGNGPAQRAIIETITAIEQEHAKQAAADAKAQASKKPMSDLELARRILFILNRAQLNGERGHETDAK